MATCSPTISASGPIPGYSLIGRLKGLAELRGVMRTLAAARQSAPRPGRMTQAEARRDGWAAFRHPDFAFYCASRFVSALAIQMQNVAVGWLVYDLTMIPLALGLVGLAGFLPAICLALVTGHVADRFDRRAVLLVCYSVTTASAAGLFLHALDSAARRSGRSMR